MQVNRRKNKQTLTKDLKFPRSSLFVSQQSDIAQNDDSTKYTQQSQVDLKGQ